MNQVQIYKRKTNRAKNEEWQKNERRTQLHTESELQSILINYLSLNILFDLEMNNTIFILTY